MTAPHSAGTQRAVPYYCPYCSDEDLRPEPEPRGAWRCAGCTRVFTVSFVGLSVAGQADSQVRS